MSRLDKSQYVTGRVLAVCAGPFDTRDSYTRLAATIGHTFVVSRAPAPAPAGRGELRAPPHEALDDSTRL